MAPQLQVHCDIAPHYISQMIARTLRHSYLCWVALQRVEDRVSAMNSEGVKTDVWRYTIGKLEGFSVLGWNLDEPFQ